jgi:hypothetical protein
LRKGECANRLFYLNPAAEKNVEAALGSKPPEKKRILPTESAESDFETDADEAAEPIQVPENGQGNPADEPISRGSELMLLE